MSSQKSPSVGSAACLVSPNIGSMMQSSIFYLMFAQTNARQNASSLNLYLEGVSTQLSSSSNW